MDTDVVNTRLGPMPAIIKLRYTSEKDCQTCRDQYQEWLGKKNSRKGINNRIANHKLVFHGVPIPPAPQPPQPKKQKNQPPGEGRWIKPVDSPHVEAKWYPKTSTSTTTWVPIANPPKFVHESSDEDDGLIGGFSFD